MSRSDTIARTFFRVINLPVDAVATAAGLIMLVAIVVQIVGRWFATSLPWTEEMTRYSFVWMVYLGLGIGFRRVESARVTMFLHLFPKPFRYLAPLIYTVVSIGFFAVILFAGVQIVSQQVMMTERGAALDIPLWLVGLSIPVAGFAGIAGILESLLLCFDRVRDSGEASQ